MMGPAHVAHGKAVRALLVLVVSVAFAAPLAAALPSGVHGSEACAAQPVLASEACGEVMMLGGVPQLFFTQEDLGCSGSTCNYRPTMRISFDAAAPGTWILRASAQPSHYPSGNPIGPERTLECSVEAPDARCEASLVVLDVVGNPFNSARWEGSWSVTWIDPLGAEHLQATGAAEGWLAQYCNCQG